MTLPQEFRELVYEMPFQVPKDLVFLFRTVAILAGICTGLDPDFNLWTVMAPYTNKMVAEEAGAASWLSEAGAILQTLIALPRKTENIIDRMNRGGLVVQTPGPERQLIKINQTLRRLVYSLLFIGLLTNGVILQLNQPGWLSIVLLVGAAVTFGSWRSSPAGRVRRSSKAISFFFQPFDGVVDHPLGGKQHFLAGGFAVFDEFRREEGFDALTHFLTRLFMMFAHFFGDTVFHFFVFVFTHIAPLILVGSINYCTSRGRGQDNRVRKGEQSQITAMPDSSSSKRSSDAPHLKSERGMLIAQ